MSDSEPLLSVRDLYMSVSGVDLPPIVKGASFDVRPREVIGLVGESGSGKTILGRSIMGLQPNVIERTSGDVLFRGKSIAAMSPRGLRSIRGAQIGMVFQEPMTSLNPSMRIGRQMDEALRVHGRLRPNERHARIVEIMERVGIPSPADRLSAYPHQFSGGMRQRIMLASAMLLRPALLIADEPTTALDALVQREVLELMIELTQQEGTALILISHDLPMVARYCERLLVMRQGEIVEAGVTERILERPAHDYTRNLLRAMPARGPVRTFDAAPPVVEVQGLCVDYTERSGLFAKTKRTRALHEVDLHVRKGEVVAVVGASGSGKTTLGRAIAGLLDRSDGRILFRGNEVDRKSDCWADYRVNCQMIFQDPYGSLDPRFTIRDIVAEALLHERHLKREELDRRVREVIREVGLDDSHLARLPHEMSGGQRQRVAIARAIIGRPDFVIADEAVSALDVTVRARVLDLLTDLQKRYGFSCLFISHDLAVVEQLADRVIVMRDGRVIEEGTRDAIFDDPQEDYTRALLSAIPRLERTETGVALSWRFDPSASGTGAVQ